MQIQEITVRGKSMSPYIGDGEVVCVKDVPSSQIGISDIVLYRNTYGNPVFHRVIRKKNDYLIVKGDNNNYKEFIPLHCVVGKMENRRYKRQPKDEWDNFLEVTDYEGISSLLYKSLYLKEDIPYKVREHLKRAYYTTLSRNILIAESLEQILMTFKEKKIDTILLKGLAFSKLLYGDIGIRPIYDIDLLIHKEDFPRCSRILKTMGYTHSSTHIENFFKGKINVDLHWDLLNDIRIKSRRSILNIDMKELWRDAITIRMDGDVRTLSLEHTLIYHTIHFLLHHGLCHTLFQFDMDRFIEVYGTHLNWQKVIQTAKKWHAEDILYICLSLSRGTGVDIDEKILKALVPHPGCMDRWLLRILRKGWPSQEIRHIYALYKINGISNKLRFLKETLLPGIDTATGVYQLDNPLSSYMRHLASIFRIGCNLFLRSVS